jgi:hypothetical protein
MALDALFTDNTITALHQNLCLSSKKNLRLLFNRRLIGTKIVSPFL